MSDLIPRRYLGDSVYAEVEAGQIKLTTHNGYPDDPRNVIFMEPSVMDALAEFYADAKQVAQRLREERDETEITEP